MVTYLLGAGASAQAVPVVQTLNENLIYYTDDLRSNLHRYVLRERGHRKQEEVQEFDQYYHNFVEGVKWIRDNVRGSIDQFALRLFQNERFEDFNRVKALLSGILTFEQLMKDFAGSFLYINDHHELNPAKTRERSIDPRYQYFWTLLHLPAPKANSIYKRFRDKVRVLSWNYDMQLELSYQEFVMNEFENNDLRRDHILEDLNLFPDYLPNRALKPLPTQFSVTKLNGTAGYYLHRDGKYSNGGVNLFGNTEVQFDTIKQIYKDVYNACHKSSSDNHHTDTSLFFAWEKDFDNEIVAQAVARTTDSEVLYVIGYSFPEYNRVIDTHIISKMTKLKKVYILDLDDFVESREEDVRDILGRRGKDMEIKLLTDVNRFRAPQELHSSFVPEDIDAAVYKFL